MTTKQNGPDLDAFLGRKPVKSRRRLWTVGGLVLLALIVFFAVRGGSGGGERDMFASSPLEKRDLVVAVTATGNLKSTREVTVGSETSGILTDVYVDNNSKVTKGQILARFDTARLKDSVLQAKASLAQAEAQVTSSEADLAKANAQYKRQLEVSKLSGGQVPSALELDLSAATVKSAEAAVLSAKAHVEVSKAQLSTAETNLSKAIIYSPVDGTVLARAVEPGQTVAASFNTPTLFTIAEDLSKMRLDVKVDEADIGQVRDGQSATFTVDAYPGTRFPAFVERVDVGASSTTSETTLSANTVVSYTARLDVDNTSGELRPGMTATASIVTEEVKGEYVVPMSAFRFTPPAGSKQVISFGPPRRNRGDKPVQIGRGSHQRIFVKDATGQIHDRNVEVLAISGSVAAVRGEGLADGLQVVTGMLAARS